MAKEGGIVIKLDVATHQVLQEERVAGFWKLFLLAGVRRRESLFCQRERHGERGGEPA